MDGAEIIDSLERCERRLAETRIRFVYDEGRAEFAYKAGQDEHAGLVKLEAELRQLADRLREFRRLHQHEPAGHAGHA